MYVVAVVRVERDESFIVYLAVRRLRYHESVTVATKRSGCVAGCKLASLGNHKLKYAVRHKNNRLGKALVKLHFDISAIGKLEAYLVARLVLAVIALVYFVAKGAELDVAVCSYKL